MAVKREKKQKAVKADPLAGLKDVLKYVFMGIGAYVAFMVIHFMGPSISEKIDDLRSNVLVLNEANFKSSLAAITGPHKEMMVEFYAPWCGHCKRLKPEYDIAATTLKAHDIKIAKVDCTKNQELCKEQDVTGYPTLKIFNPEGESSKYDGGLNADSIVSKMLHELKSEPVPAEQGDNKKIVAKNFQELVVDSDKDVFVKFYAPWCGHCKAMAPAWEEFATKYKDDSSLIIGDFDATANELELDVFKDLVKGYPTILWMPKGDKLNPVKFSGSRDLEGFEKWVSENGSAAAEPKDEL